jgi:hypothetical protein
MQRQQAASTFRLAALLVSRPISVEAISYPAFSAHAIAA